ncbi:MAG: PrsW family intramembrane metalloprotease [Firmicutes bacterium]|nr:PrsW family intramembrane metalloprotease [Bacillota bacterium]
MNYLVGLAILPVVFLLKFIYDKDNNKEPSRLLRKTFIFGMIIIVPCIIIELLLQKIFPIDNNSDLLFLFVCVFISVALVEEFFKWIIVKIIAYKNDEFDEMYDGIVYSIYSSLGFACLENICFVLMYGAKTGVYRAFTAVPSHACDAILMGYFFGRSKQHKCDGDNRTAKKYLFLSLFVPTLIHAIYDYLLMSKILLFFIIWIVFVIVIFIICFKLVNKCAKNNIKLLNIQNSIVQTNNNYCTNCGSTISNDDNFCKKCGNQIKRL